MTARERRLCWHFAAVLVPTVLALLMVAGANPDEGACIGCGLFLMPLYLLGLPWNLLAVALGMWPRTSTLWTFVLAVVPALINVGLHWLYVDRKEDPYGERLVPPREAP